MKGWEIKKLCDVCEFDKTPHKGEAKQYVGMEDIESGSGVFLGNFGPSKAKSLTFRFSHTHVLYGRLRPYLNKVLAPNFDGHCSTEIFPIQPKPCLVRQFLFYWLTSEEICRKIDATCTGARMPRANMNAVLDFDFPLPPLDEQRRIVAILDEAFAGLASMRANAQNNLKNARALFDSHLNEIFSQKGEGWREGPLKELCGQVSTGPFGSLLHKSDYVSGGIPLVNPAHIVEGRIVPETEKTVNPEALEQLSAYKLKEGDIVIGRRGEIGRCALVTSVEDGWLCGTGSFFIRPTKKANPAFIAHLLRSNRYRQVLEKASTGATMLNLSNASLADLTISIPDLETQNSLLKSADDVLTEVENLEALYRQKLAAIDELKQAILQKAFAGELTANRELAA